VKGPAANQPPQAAEARRSSRHAPRTPVAVVDAMSSDLIGFVVDLSAGGMKLMAGKPLVDDALYQVQFELDMDASHRARIEAGTQVVSQHRNSDGSATVGLRFIHLQGPQGRQLGEWLHSRTA
jgi:c-di-GMP-binding flagellar brake protein YcgR